jgi:hypothetical protein
MKVAAEIQDAFTTTYIKYFNVVLMTKLLKEEEVTFRSSLDLNQTLFNGPVFVLIASKLFSPCEFLFCIRCKQSFIVLC